MLALPQALDQMGTLVTDNPPQREAVGRMRQLVSEKLRELRTTIDERKAGRPEAALAVINTDHGQRVMDEFRALVTAMEIEENRLLAQRQVSAAAFGTVLQASAGAAFVLICLVALLGSILTRRSFHRARRRRTINWPSRTKHWLSKRPVASKLRVGCARRRRWRRSGN